MSLLDNVSKGKIKKPILAVVYGPDGVGKSTFAASAPHPIFLGTEDGTSHLDVTRFPTPQNFEDVFRAIKELSESKHDYKTLVIDTLDWLEPSTRTPGCVLMAFRSCVSTKDRDWETSSKF